MMHNTLQRNTAPERENMTEQARSISRSGEDVSPYAIVLGCRKPGWGIIRALGKSGIATIGAYYDRGDIGRTSRYLSATALCPHPEREEQAFIAFIQRLAVEYPHAVVIPSDDYSVVALSRIPVNSTGTLRIATPDESIVTQCIEKDRTYQLANSVGVRTPRTQKVDTLDHAIEFANTLGFPCLLKPAVGHRFYNALHAKMFRVHTTQELSDLWERAAAQQSPMLIQELIPGGDDQGVNYNALWQAGQPRVELTAAKRRLSPRGIGFPTVVVNDYVPEIIEPSRKLLAALGYHGFANVEFKRDSRTGEFVLMEINPRLNLSLLLSVETGMNFATMLFRQRLGQDPGDYTAVDPYNPRCYYIDTWQDIREALREITTGKLSLGQFLAPYFSRHVSATLSLSDPLPVIRKFF